MTTKPRHRTPARRRTWPADPSAHLRVLGRVQDFSPAEAGAILLPPREAFERMRGGHGADDDFHTLACAVNITMVSAERISPLAEAPAIAARDALMRTLHRHQKTAQWGFDGPALQQVADALDLYDQIVALSTPQQMRAAMSETIRRMEAGVVA